MDYELTWTVVGGSPTVTTHATLDDANTEISTLYDAAPGGGTVQYVVSHTTLGVMHRGAFTKPS